MVGTQNTAAAAEQGQEPLRGLAWTAAVLSMAQAVAAQGLGLPAKQETEARGVRIPLAVEPQV